MEDQVLSETKGPRRQAKSPKDVGTRSSFCTVRLYVLLLHRNGRIKVAELAKVIHGSLANRYCNWMGVIYLLVLCALAFGNKRCANLR